MPLPVSSSKTRSFFSTFLVGSFSRAASRLSLIHIFSLAYIDWRAAARAFADGLSAGIEAVCLGLREEGIGFDQIGGCLLYTSRCV